MRCACVFLLFLALDAQAPAPPPRVPVLVELFTSEGCSSCPPADRLLSEVVRTQPVPGAQVIGLGLHVDYWDSLGWKDGASFHGATARQQHYADVLSGNVYTPQAVIDGHDEVVGSDSKALLHLVEKAAARPRARVKAVARRDGSALIAEISVSEVPFDVKEALDGYLAIVEDDVVTFVKRGENSGRTLRHDCVVRELQPLGAIPSRQTVEKRIAVQTQWSSKTYAVVFLQGHRTERIWAADVATVR
jgi:hypothetical protein